MALPNRNKLPFKFDYYDYDTSFDYEAVETNDVTFPSRRGGRKRRRIDPSNLFPGLGSDGFDFGVPQIMGSGGNPFADTGLSDRRPGIPMFDVDYIQLSPANYSRVETCDEVYTCPRGKLAYFRMEYFDTEGKLIVLFYSYITNRYS